MSPREFTPRGLALGLLLGAVLGGANAYLGLYAGMTVSASIPAAVASMALLRALGGASVLENNFVQTVASAGEAVAAGAIFTLPALAVLGHPDAISYWRVTLLCAVGATLGSMLVIMLRRAYIVEERLPFPEGRACAEVLRSGAAQDGSARALLWGGLLAALTKAASDIGGLLPAALGYAGWAGGAAWAVSVDLSAALLGVGYIIGLPIALVVLAGAAVAWFVAVPWLSLHQPGLQTLAPAQAAALVWSRQVRFMGVGAMLMGGLITLARLRGAIGRALMELGRSRLTTKAMAREETDMPASLVIAALGLALLAMWALYGHVAGSWRFGLMLALMLGVIGFFAASVAGYLTGMVGASNNPVSGVTLIILLAVALILRVSGIGLQTGPVLAILVSAVVAVAAAMAGDSLHDLATGFHLRATPRVLEMGVLIGALASSAVVAPVLKLLIDAYGIAGTPGARAGALAAPQAFLMAQVVRGVFAANLPWTPIVAGGLVALAAAVLDRALQSRGSRWRASPMPFAIGLYLPFGLSAAVALGALVNFTLDSRRQARRKDQGRAGMLFAAGLITGEALMGIASAALVIGGLHLPLR